MESKIDTKLTVVVFGLGQMGRSHALAYHNNPGYRVLALVNRSAPRNLPVELERYKLLQSFEEALSLKPDVVSINTHADIHASYTIQALQAGCHVFVEKPIATTVEDAERVVDMARRLKRKVVVGYILRHHPSWQEFIRQTRLLGGPPYVMRMNLNQRSSGSAWEIHKSILKHASPVIDCGVHYVDVMLQITDSKPVQVRGIGARLSYEISDDRVNYGHLQVMFADGSIGWYEAGWGPMISETAWFVKDVMGPNGSVSIVMEDGGEGGSADVDGHTKTNTIKVHRVGQDRQMLSMEGEPDHNQLCYLQQQFLFDAIQEDRDLSEHLQNAVRSLLIVLAADQSMREKRAVDL